MADSFDDKGENLGSPATPEEVNTFIAKLGKASKLSTEESLAIEKVFVKNKNFSFIIKPIPGNIKFRGLVF
ncbi:hypothetical protein [Chryseobacterium sp.]|uniref:hypothetical protein n=1 Tax=Chryseobacterium sp. TaxID=1871047 RepID=UPI0023F26FFE|nr:hypothetical protein [Chryseobacterium sp.]